MTNKSHRVKILPNGVNVLSHEKDTLLETFLANGVMVDNLCGGKGICGKCNIRIVRGTPSNLTRQEEKWQKIYGSNMRLACQTKILSDAEVELNNSSKVSKMKILAWGHSATPKNNPIVKIKNLRMEKPNLSDQEADLSRILRHLEISLYDPAILGKISSVLWDSEFNVDTAIYEQELIDLFPHSEESKIYGIAFDIGTTTVVGYLYELSSAKMLSVKSDYNGQIRFGEDVISRIEYASKSVTNMIEVHEAIIQTMNKIISELLDSTGVSKDRVYEVVCSGNTVMVSFLFWSDCYHSSRAPYISTFTSSVRIKAKDLGMMANPLGYVRTLPSVSAYVGGDVVADILVSNIYEAKGPSALIDLGTNGEVIVKTSDGLLASSCASGPALEGYGVTNGMRGVEGAIESITVSEDGNEVYFRVIGDGKPIGICGSGIIDALAWMKVRGIVDRTGRIIEGSSRRVKRNNGQLCFVLVNKKDSVTNTDIAICQSDVRKLQLAKAAIFSTLLTLMKIGKVDIKSVKKLYVAGAFGTYTDPFSAITIGLLPEMSRNKIIQIGNGSGAGASSLLLSKNLWSKAVDLSRKVKVIELNLVPSFKDEFIKATFIPHKDESLFPNALDSKGSRR
jgi:uncharacterized 2Fe-2S/4Fe-4S cluster protein (DUF4445 family)